jgi:hypothetical protein
MNIAIWPGSSSFSTGSTPFGFYDSDTAFSEDADRVATFCARRMGYPIVEIELQDINFYTAFEEAITTYGNQLYSYKVRDNQLTMEGLSTGSSLNKVQIQPNFESIIRLTEMYGVEARSGGNVEYYSGSVDLIEGQQDYDLKAWASSSGIDMNYGIEVKKVFYEAPPAITRYYDPYSGTGFGYRSLFDSFGFSGMSPAVNFLMMPISYDAQVLNAIELNDQMRRNNFSFELHNNTLKIFPIPIRPGKMWFEYIKREDRINSSVVDQPGTITNVSNVPYFNPVYAEINSIGRQWIFEYTLALAKEMLGYVRGKYSTIPIPNSSMTLNQGDLITAATAEKSNLIERLRMFFDETSRKSQLERRSLESEYKNQELKNVPFTIYIG